MATTLLDRLSAPRVCRHEGASIVEIATGRREPFHAIVGAARAVATKLEDAGLKRGEPVLLHLPPGIDWAVAFLGALFAGAAATPVPLAAPPPEIAYLASDAGVRFAFSNDALASSLPSGLSLMTAGIFEPSILRAPSFEARPEDAALVLYTSGTTGRPKGAVLTHENLGAQTIALERAWGFNEDDVLLHALPMHHLHGVVVAFLTAFATPATIRMLPRFDAKTVLEELERATVFMGVPTMYARMVEHIATLDAAERARLARGASSLRLATSGSAALPASLAGAWQAFAGSIPLERYGMTEIGIGLSNPLDPTKRRPGMVGTPLPSVEARIVDERGQPTDGPGDLEVRGPSVMARYLGREDATKDAFREGWFRTGDVAMREEDGFYKLLGRASADILKSGGEKVSALEVEAVLLDHDAIAEVAVVGVPDPAWGDRIVAAVVPRAGLEAACSTDAIRAWAKERLVAYKVPRQIVTLPVLPRNAMGKVMKNEIVKSLTERTS